MHTATPAAFAGHPCFDPSAHRTSARVHLPVAPRCNIQCRYCNRQTDCLHESRPGVSSGVLTPAEAEVYLEKLLVKVPQTKVVGIAGPGDPLANPDETFETLARVRRAHPELLLCLATNGLALPAHLDQLKALGVSHVTVTVNSVDPEVGRTIYDWMRWDRRTHQGIEAAEHLWDQQRLGLEGLAARGIVAKVNTLYIPGVNDFHVGQVAQTVAHFGAQFHNLIPLYPVPGTAFGVLPEPDAETLRQARAHCALHLPQMTHCRRCRADAAGLLGEDVPTAALMAEAKAAPAAAEPCSPAAGCATSCALGPTCASARAPKAPPAPVRPRRAAAATLEGVLVNLHLGQAPDFAVYEEAPGGWKYLETRPAPATGGGDRRWYALAEVLEDCAAVFTGGAGDRPLTVLGEAGIEVYTVEGLIDDLLGAWGRGGNLGVYLKREVHACGDGCRGTGTGCG